MITFSRISAIVSAITFISVLALPASSAAADWQARLHGQWVSSSGEFFADEELDDAFGVYLGVERRLDERWGVEVGLGWNELDSSESFAFDLLGFSIRTDVEARVETIPLTAAVNYHLTPESSRADVYIAPVIGWAFIDAEIETRVRIDGLGGLPGFPVIPPVTTDDRGTTDVDVEDGFLYGLRLGVDWPVGDSGWAVSGAVEYSALELEVEGGTLTDLDPLRVGVGVALRF